MGVYLNNAATSFPKAEGVVQAVSASLLHPSIDHRRTSGLGWDPGTKCRRSLASLLGDVSPSRIAFCSGATEALNQAINGCAPSAGHIITTVTEHNAVLRPLYRLREVGDFSLSFLPCDAWGRVDPRDLIATWRDDTCLVVVNHGSNVSGTIQDVEAFHDICRERGVPLIIDAAQTAGNVKIPCHRFPMAAVALTGHKGLLGPAGIGALWVGDELSIEPWKVGGTGVGADLQQMPPSWPSVLEPGTPNLPGIAGLGAALDFLSSWEHGFLAARKEGLVRDLTDALRAVPGARVFGSPERYPQSGIVSFTLDRWSPGELGQLLREGFDVHVRTGLQCAPLIHDPLGAGPEGSVRVSLSVFNTETDISVLLDSLTQIQGARAA